MNQLTNPQIPGQHVPAGWGFPTLQPQTPPPAPGHGTMTLTPATTTRVRWGRLLAMLAGIALIAFGIWSFTQQDAPSKDTSRATPSGAGASDIDIPRSAGTDGAATDSGAIAPPARVVRPAKAPVRRAAAATGAAGAQRAPAGQRAVVRSAAPAPMANRSVSGGGGQALPYTGIETWIAAFLGLVLLAGGVCVHVNAVRIGMTAMLYRRGILLRPVECARLAQSHAPARLRVLISDVLHRLLEEPAVSGEFVSARLAR